MASEQGKDKGPTAQGVRAKGPGVVIAMSRCTGCGRIGNASAKVHTCYIVRNEWGEHERDHYEPTELVDFALIPDSARPHGTLHETDKHDHDCPRGWVEYVRADAYREAVEALESLRAAWNAHMATCPQHAAVRAPTFEEIEAWRNAPSNTASGGQSGPGEATG